MQEDYKTDNLWFMKGDCLERMKEIPDGSVDMVLTDPPYGTTACKWDSIIPLEPMWEQLKRVIKPDGAVVLTGNEPFSSHLRLSNLNNYKYDWKWDKVRGSNFATVKIRPFNSFEDVMVFYKKQPTYNPQMWDGKPYEQKQGYVGEAKQTNLKRKSVVTKSDGRRYPLSIIRFSKESGVHPTQKPVTLMEYLIKTYTNIGETVLDFTSGSFTTGVACVNLGRNFIGIEIDNHYYDIGTDRVLNTIANKLEEN
jgi:site-specific DNA-methyltransferase (adenine-specific)